MTLALLYCRQSVSDSEDTLSLDSQAATLRRWADEQGWRVVGEIRDADQRGWKDDRPGLLSALQRAAAREYDLLLVWSLDRLARSVRIQENTLHELSRHGVAVRSHTEPWVAQPLFRVILGAVAEEQTRVMSGHMRRVFAERSRRGLPHGRAPYGYQRDPETRKLMPRDEQADLVRGIFSRFAAGMGTTELAGWLTASGVPTWTGRRQWAATTVRCLLENPIYTGVIAIAGVRTEDAHPPLIDAAIWQRVQDRLADYTWTRRKDGPRSWLEGHIEHACGHRMYYKSQPTRESTNPAFICAAAGHGRCPIRPGRCAVAHAEDAAWSLLTRALAELRPVEPVLRRMQREEATIEPRVRSDRQRALDQQRALESERQVAEELYLRGRRDRAWFDAVDDRIAAELAAIANRLAELPAPIDADATMSRHEALRAMAGSLDLVLPADRGPLLAALGTVVVCPGTNRKPPVRIRWREPWRPFVQAKFALGDG